MRRSMKMLPCALILAITTAAVQGQVQDRGDRYRSTPSHCLGPPPNPTASSSPNSDGRSGVPPARAAANADNGGPANNGFAPPARLDIHGQPLAPPPAPPRPRAEQGQCTEVCEAGYAMVMNEQLQAWCERIKPQVIHISMPLTLKPAGIEAPFNLKDSTRHALNPNRLAPWQGRVVLQVIGSHGKPLAGVAIKLVQTVEDDSGHHPERLHTGQRPLAVLFLGKTALKHNQRGEVTTPMVTDAQGEIRLFFSAPPIAGTHLLKAECVQHACKTYAARVTVKVPDLEKFRPVKGSSELVGGPKEKHDERHYLTGQSLENLSVMISAMNKFSWKPVGVNDAALPWGGLFDITGEWLPSHFDHGAGTAVDIRTKGVALETKAATYKSQCSASEDPGALRNQLPITQILWHKGSTEHFHVYLEGTAPNGTAKPDCVDQGGWMKKAEKQANEKRKQTAVKKG